MKTLQVGLDWYPERAGGLQRYYHDLIQAAPGQFEATGVVLGSERVAAETGGRVRAFASADASLLRRVSGVRAAVGQAMKAGDLDLTASHFALFTLPALDLIRTPLVVHFHGPWAAESGVEGQLDIRQRLKHLVETTVFRRAQGFIVLSGAFRDVLIRDYGVPGERIRVVPGGVDCGRFNAVPSRRDARDQLGWPQDRPILLAVRRLVRRMGLDVLIEAMSDIVRQIPEALLLIAGKGPIAGELQARLEAAGLERNVRLLGFVSDADLPLAYRAADLTVVPTQALEGFGLIVLESLAAGTPAVVTPVGGLPEVVTSLDPRLVCDGTSRGAVAERIAYLLRAEDRPTSEICRAYASGFDWSIIAKSVARIYKDVLAEAAGH